MNHCRVIVDSDNAPIVSWTGMTRAGEYSYHFHSCVARWSEQRQQWEGLASGLSDRDLGIYVGINDQDRLYAATAYRSDNSTSPTTTRAWKWSGSNWEPIWNGLPHTVLPILAVQGDTLYLADSDESTNQLTVVQLRNGAWLGLPSPGTGALEALAITQSGHPVLAYSELYPSRAIRVRYFADDAWQEVGTGISTENEVAWPLDLRLDAKGRPVVAWTTQQTSGDTSHYEVFAARYSAPLP